MRLHRFIINLVLLSLVGTGFATSCYMIEVTKPDSGWIACDEVLVEGTVGYRLFDFPGQELTSTRPYHWTDSSSAPGFADEASDTVGEPTCRRRKYDEDTGEYVFRPHHGNDLVTTTGEQITACYTCILTLMKEDFTIHPTSDTTSDTLGYGYHMIYYIPELDISIRLAHLENNWNSYAIDTLFQPGEVLGYAGMSGRSTTAKTNNVNPHVHTEIFSGRVDNSNYNQKTTLDPAPYLFGEASNHADNGQVFLSVSGGILKDSIEAEDDLGPVTIYTPSEDINRRFRDPKPHAVYQHTFNIEDYDNGNIFAEALVCSTYGFPGTREILDSDEQPGQKLCGNYTYIVQTGGYSTLEETYNYTDHWNSECRSPDYYDFYDFDNWGIYEIDHIERKADQITVEGAVFHMPWNKDGIEYIAVLSDENTVCDTIDESNVTQTSDTRTDWTYTFPADEPPYGFAVKTSYLNSSIVYWPKARWARIKNERTFAYQKVLGCSGYITIVDHPTLNANTGWVYCDSLYTTTKEMERKKYQWGIDIDAQSVGLRGFVLHVISILGRTEPEPPFETDFGKFLIAEPYFASRYGGFAS